MRCRVSAMSGRALWVDTLIAANQAREGFDDAIANALADELVEALAGLDFVVVGDGPHEDGVCAAVIEGTRACCVEFAPQPGRERALLSAISQAVFARGATRLWSGGPPRWYLRSGADDHEARVWVDLGARVASRHMDITVDPATCRRSEADTAVERVAPAQIDDAARWIAQEFSNDWEAEAREAARRDALFVCRYGSQIAAFAAHSGHAAARGTFGPLGTTPSARGKGLGRRVASAAIEDLGSRGFSAVIVPWVEPAVVALYERVAAVLDSRSRVLFTLHLAGPTK